ncbi:MAG: bifunctional salicylyl-CoA 5-hydroxylase/oxidoreductase [Acidobacteriota bacterium]
MKVVSIGGGPSGLYAAILLRTSFPDVDVTVYERNRPKDTFGWGVVFSDETLDGIAEAEPETFAAVRDSFVHWRDIVTHVHGERVVSTGHGFSALSRRRLLEILTARAEAVGVDLRFETEIDDVAKLASQADLVIGADGVNSRVRDTWASTFQPDIDMRQCRFCWLGTDLPLDAFTFIFEPTEYGLFQVHAYPFEQGGRATWIVECHDSTWHAAGLADADEAATVDFCERLFAPYLDGHRLLTNRSIWRRFPTISCRTWRHDNVILLGDAAHTAHFSIGSGTKLAIEDAIVLVDTLRKHGTADLAGALAAYEDERWVEVVKLQKAAQTSLEWFENSERYMPQPALQFTFNLMTRSKRITYDNLGERDPDLVSEVATWYQGEQGRRVDGASPTPPIFTPFSLRGLELPNRIVVSAMCQYRATDGVPDDWHLVHLGSRAVGAAGLIMTEMTNVTPEGRITPGCTGIWNDPQTDAWARIVDFVHHEGGRIGIQLGHAGRKGSAYHPWVGPDRPLTAAEGAWPLLAPSAVALDDGWPVPRAMTRDDMDRMIEAYVTATERAERAGFDLVEVHMAHGYLLSSFLTPLANRRDDDYGGSIENRARFPLEVFAAVRRAWPADKPVAVRVTATDWMSDDSGIDMADTVAFAKLLRDAGCDLVDVSSGGNAPESEPIYGRMYQVPFADQIRAEVGIPVMAVGAILDADHANTVLAAGRADLVAMARPHLVDPYLTLHAAEQYEYYEQSWPGPYQVVAPKPPRTGPAPRRRWKV